MNELTQDGIFSRAITIWQHKHGYRFSIDAVLLALFARPHAQGARVLELGAGSGVVSMILAHKAPEVALPKEIVAVELQNSLAGLAQKNIEENQKAALIKVVQEDLKRVPTPETGKLFDLVVSNPPYFPLDSSAEEVTSEERAIARREVNASVSDVLSCAARSLHAKGSLALVYPAPLLPRFFAALAATSLRLIAWQPVYSLPKQDATLALLLCKQPTGKNPPPLSVMPPIFLSNNDGTPNPEIERLLLRGY